VSAASGEGPQLRIGRPIGRAASFAWIALAYAVAGVVAALVANAQAGEPVWKVIAVADAAATLVIFAFSAAFNNSSVYDPYWSLVPMAVAPALALAAEPEVPLVRRVVVTLLVCAWGARLTYNWARGFPGLSHEDFRYVDMRRQTGRGYWLVSLIGLHFVPTLTVYLGMLPLLPALRAGARPLGPLDALGALVTALAIALEATADAQLRAFRKKNATQGKIMAEGLWGYCRHPNYVGEMGFWWGLYLFGLAADPGAYQWTAPGPLWITALFVFISVPMLDKRSLARRPGYREHMERVPALLPRLGRRG
jgi:steroid 5-alpha reductase family enzyme